MKFKDSWLQPVDIEHNIEFEPFAKKALDKIRPRRINLMVIGINCGSLPTFKQLNPTNGMF